MSNTLCAQRILSVGAVLQLLVGWAVSVLGGMVRQAAPICNANLQHTYATPIRASVSVLATRYSDVYVL